MTFADRGSHNGMPMIHLEPAAREVIRLLDGVTDDRLAGPTPCPGYPVGALLDHFMGLSLAFTWAARKSGMTEAGGVRMPAEVMGVVALDELVLHGWDLARATGQPFTCDPVGTAAVLAFTSAAARPEQAAGREGLFGPVVEVPEGAPAFDRLLGFAGRDPAWRPA
jgi:hypothetical protein